MIPNYRAWDKEDKRMSYGEIEYYDDSFGVRFDHFCVGADFEVEFMQSTGLKDKDGGDVYQGDIIRCTRGCPHEVIWLEEYGGTFFGGMPAWYLSGLSNGYAWTGREEVIGNIYENSELLEEQ